MLPSDPQHGFSQFSIRRLQRWMENEKVFLLYINWGFRSMATLLLAVFFIRTQQNYSAETLGRIFSSILIFAVYNILVGLAGVMRPVFFTQRIVKHVQVLFEIGFYSLFYYLTGDPRSEVYILYLSPLYVAARFLDRPRLLGALITAVFGMTIAGVAAPGPVDSGALRELIIARSLLLGWVALAFGVPNRPPLVEEVQEERAQLKMVLEGFDEGVFICDKNLRLLYLNDALRLRHGAPVQGQTIDTYFQKKVPHPFLASLAKSAQNESAAFALIDGQGRAYNAQISSFIIRGETNETDVIVGFVRDVDRQKQVEQQLDEKTRRVDVLTSNKDQWLQTYKQLGTRLASTDEPKKLMDYVVEEARTRLLAECAMIFIADTQGVLRRKAVAGVEEDWLADEQYLPGEGITGQAVVPASDSPYGEPIRRNKVDQDEQVVMQYLAEYRQRLNTGTVRHLLAAPLNGSARSFGVLRVVNKLQIGGALSAEGFSEDDQDFLVTIASIVAVAIENVHTYHQLKNLYHIVQNMARTIEIEDLYQVIVNDARQFIPRAEKVTLYSIDPSTEYLILRANQPEFAHTGYLLWRKDESLVGQSIAAKTTLYEPNCLLNPQALPPEISQIVSLLVAPILIKSDVYGVIILDSGHSHAFQEEDIQTLEALATQSGHAIEKAHLYYNVTVLSQELFDSYNKERIRARQGENLLTASLAINSNLGETEFYPELLKQFERMIGHTSVSIQMLRNDRLHVTHCDGFRDPEKVLSLSFPINDPQFPNFFVIQDKKAYIFNNVQQEYPHFFYESELYQTGSICSWMGAPMLYQGKVIGMIAFDSEKPGYFTEDMQGLAQVLANHTAVAMSNIHRLREEKDEADRLRRFLELVLDLSRQGEGDEALRACTLAAAGFFRVEDCSIYLIGKKRNSIDLNASSAIPPQLWTNRDSYLNKPGLTAHVANTGELLNFGGDEYKTHAAWSGRYLEHLRYLPSQSCHSLLIGPIRDERGEIIGVLKLENRLGEGAGQRFSIFEEALHRMFADEIGLLLVRQARRQANDAIGHELHDLSNFIHGAVVLRLAKLKSAFDRSRKIDIKNEVDLLHSAVVFAHSQITRVHTDFRNQINIEELGLRDSLASFAKQMNVDVAFNFNNRGRRHMPVGLEYVLYKIGSEAISNIQKHAWRLDEGGNQQPAGGIIELDIEEDDFCFTIVDDGCGLGEDWDLILRKEDAYGLRNMRRLAKSIGCALSIGSAGEAGVRIQVTGKIANE